MAADTIQCKYFPMLPARWRCLQCKVNMANECAKVSLPHQPDKKSCPICDAPLQSIGIANSIKPFWERIPKFFSYPAKFDSIIYIAILTLVVLVGFFIPLINIGIAIFAFFGLLRYACQCLYQSARGNLSPPGVMAHTDKSGENIPVKLCGLFIFIYFVITEAFLVNKILGLTIIAFSLLSIPAMTILLAITESFGEAINPFKVMKIMFGMGKSYLLLYLFLMLMYGSSQLLEHWATSLVSEYIVVSFIFFINAYFTIAMFSMMGYAIYQYHEEFGFDGVTEVNLVEEGVNLKASGISQDSFLNEIHILISEGLLDEAGKRLQKKLKESHGSLQYHEKYHTLLMLAKDSQALQEHTTEFLKLLLGQDRVNKGQAITVYTDCLRIHPDYFYPNAEITVNLAKTAQELYRHQEALLILTKFAEHYPDNAQIPYAYFLIAQLLVDYKQQDEQARKIMLSLLHKYPTHELVPELQKYLGVLDNLSKHG